MAKINQTRRSKRGIKLKKIQKIISNIFEEYNFDQIFASNFKEDSINIFHNLQQNEYNVFVVDYRNDIPSDYLSDITPDLREEVDGTIKSLEIDGVIENFDRKINKNMYLIVCLKNENISGVNRKILEIEEDPYYFKKSVIYYNDKELLTFNDSNNKKNYAELIIETVTDEELFSQYKHSESNSMKYEICLKFVMAMPILTLNMKTSDFPDLAENIVDKLTYDNLNELNVLVQKMILTSGDLTAKNLEKYIEENDILNYID